MSIMYLQGQEENMHIEEQFRKEISAQSKLVELYKVYTYTYGSNINKLMTCCEYITSLKIAFCCDFL